MENMENNVVAMENAGAADVAVNATIGQKVLGGFLGACTIVGVVTIAKKVAKGIRGLVGKLRANKANEQDQETNEGTPVSEDETK